MPDQPTSQMIRVPTPLIEVVRELSRLHRQGRTRTVLEGVQQLIQAIDSNADIDIDSMGETISKLSERLNRLEAQQSDSNSDINTDRFAYAVWNIDERLKEAEDDIRSIAVTITDLKVRVSGLESVGDIGYAVTPLSELEALDDIAANAEPTAEAEDSSLDIGAIAEPQPVPQAPLTQKALAARLSASEKTIHTFRQKGKESFAEWSRKYDPDGKAWTWEGQGGSGRSLRFVPWSTSPLP